MNKHNTLTTVFAEIAYNKPNQNVIHDLATHQTISYSDLFNSACNIKKIVLQAQKSSGEKAIILLENRPEWSMVFFGTLLADWIAIPIDPNCSSSDLEYFLEHSQSKIVFTSNQYYEKIASLTKKINIINVDTIDISKKNDFDSSLKNRVKHSPESTAVILYTSGTTGKPKGVMLSHANLLANYSSIDALNLFTEKHNILAILPLFHSLPLMVTLIMPILSGNKITYPKAIAPDAILDALQKNNITVIAGVPQLFHLFYEKIKSGIENKFFLVRWLIKLTLIKGWYFRKFTGININKFIFRSVHKKFGAQLKYFISGGAKLDSDAATLLSRIGFTILEGYGLTETSPILTFNLPTRIKIGSAGVAIPNVKLKINHPDKNGTGEILAAGPNIMQGYYKNAIATKEVIKNGWFYTGDLGYLDNDGFLFVTGRKKELIVLSSGKNISPGELEKLFLKSPFIKEIAIALTKKGKNEILHAAIVPDFEYFRKKEIASIEQSIKWQIDTLSKQLPAYKHILGFTLFKEELPKTRLGKLKRHEISELLSKKSTQIKNDLDDSDLKIITSAPWENLVAIVKKFLDAGIQIHPSDHLEIDLGIDSLTRTELLTTIEKTFAVKITSEKLLEISNLRDIYNLIISSKKIKITGPAESPWKIILSDFSNKNLIDQINLHQKKITQLFSYGVIKLCYGFSKLYWRLKSVGRNNLPKNISFILCVNHCSYLDAEIIAMTVPTWLREKLFFLGSRVIFEKPALKQIGEIGNIIPIDQDTALIDAMQAASYVLKNNKCLCIFPEGERSIDGNLKPFKKGIGILVKELKVPVIPVSIRGSYQAWARGGSKFPKPASISVKYGKILAAEELIQKASKLKSKNDYEAIAKICFNEVLDLF